MKIIEKIINLETQEETITERDETLEEIKIREKNEAERQLLKIEQEQKLAQRAIVLEKLGLTADEIAALLG
jgi:hypothetical protein